MPMTASTSQTRLARTATARDHQLNLKPCFKGADLQSQNLSARELEWERDKKRCLGEVVWSR